MSRRRFCLTALALQTLLPFASAAYFENHADALRELEIPVARSVHALQPVPGRQLDKRIAARSKRKGTDVLRNTLDGSNYVINITLGGQSYGVLFDTASSAFWLPRANFTCVDFNNKVQPQSACGFASYGPQDYTGGQVANQNFNASYVTGEFAVGTVGREKVTFAGLTVPDQHIGLVDRTYFYDQNGFTSGIMGWGLGNYTSYYSGNDPSLDDATDPKHTWIPTNTWIQNAVKEGLLEKPIFSVNLGNRTENAANLSISGFVAVGGAPLKGLPYTGVWANSAVHTETYQGWGLKNKYSHWNVRPDGFQIGENFIEWSPGTFANTDDEVFTVIDTGAAWTYVTNETAVAIANSLQPPATWSPYDTAYIALCNATVPKISIRINGTNLPINKRDILMDGWAGQANTSTTLCWLGYQPVLQPKRGGSAPYILGDTFLRNVLAVFDVGNLRMAFASLDWQ
ncbi:uncharacterized protein SETTUDRAFT_27350 [Exserohilum turcica Et28A]|uniref:Peptidase A1 domain-containing protein n=1 Tax=Exserohilum turcicum (strain 28A) TaxID=671987 RepID=R0K6B7_EXST2|nr:uncharacterized protein SETTUDRAFT_27350 [Exserohilum turcica Et28A]EOA88548.1 hypothetical protein SETTUDRAFT_27350 [Exserohilum turcica Et28A]